MEKSWISDNIVDQYWQEPLRINQLDMLQSRNCSVADAWYSTVQSYHYKHACIQICFSKDLSFVLWNPLFDWCSCAPPTLLGGSVHIVTCSLNILYTRKMAYFRLAKSHDFVVNLTIWRLISHSFKLTFDCSCFQESHTPKNWSICRVR